ncbi:D-alanyl-D-alanine dipeptidase [Paenibacillus sp. V4I3]|uniref:hypothetical protein n=1 Tax=Paenibacillus sp. V4I3 TaxID=3042305 RepID=UPI00277F5132|nr:hypothetical protein [Paenibacillus sp. V4I3]MDQ0876788.1 D-alanyl-D-alanine dipeptidase [Paenibacillus sp. V4I3]
MPKNPVIKAKGYRNLTELQQNLFKRAYTMHSNAMGTEKQHKLDQLKEIKWDMKERCLKVYFKNGDWWHYCLDGTWF